MWLLGAIVGVDSDRETLSRSVVAEKGTEPGVMAASLIVRGLLSAHREDGTPGRSQSRFHPSLYAFMGVIPMTRTGARALGLSHGRLVGGFLVGDR